MLIEAVKDPIRCRWVGGEVTLKPGLPVDLPEDRAKKLLEKAPGRVRAVAHMLLPSLSDQATVIESASCRPVYFESMDGQLHGPCPVSFMARTGQPGRYEFWLCVEVAGRARWIRDTLLRRPPENRLAGVGPGDLWHRTG